MSSTKLFHPVPLLVSLLNRVSLLLHLDQRRQFGFDPGQLVQEAVAQTGLQDFGDLHFLEPLRVLCGSLEAADLTPVGRHGLRGMILTLLKNRLFLNAAAGESREFPSRPPLVILGLPRSGTTLLHRLLSLDPQFRALPFWRLMRPAGTAHVSRRKAEVERLLWIRRCLTSELDRKHFTRAESPEECIWLQNSTFVSGGFWVAAPVYSYVDFLLRTDRSKSYQEYANYLAWIEAEQPGRRLLLKAPSHLGALDELRSALSGVLLVQTHRSPEISVASLSSLIRTVHSAVCGNIELFSTCSMIN